MPNSSKPFNFLRGLTRVSKMAGLQSLADALGALAGYTDQNQQSGLMVIWSPLNETSAH